MKNTEDKKEVKEKNIHEGHRKRLVDLAVKGGFDSLSNFTALELFLTYIFPRGDVNPLAHRLLAEFESFTHIVDASVEDLKRVDGINDRSAKMITLFKDLFYFYTTAKMGKKYVVSSMGEIVDMIEDHLRFRTTENMFLFALSAANIVTHKRRFDMSKSGEVGVPILEFTNFLASSKPASLVVAHCHPYGRAVPSDNDLNAFEIIKDVCETCGVNLIDSLIVGEDGVYSQREEKMLRKYYDFENVKDKISDFVS